MRPKELVFLLGIGLIVGGVGAWLALQQRTSSLPVSVEKYGLSQSSIPESSSEKLYIHEQNFFPLQQTIKFNRKSNQFGRMLESGESLITEILTTHGTLGLIIETRVIRNLSGTQDNSLWEDSIGIKLTESLNEETAPLLQVFWDDKKVKVHPLTSSQWKNYYVKILGDGQVHSLKLQINKTRIVEPLQVAIKRIRLFDQDKTKSNRGTRIGIEQAKLRVESIDRKIVVLGLDGLSWKIAEPLLAEGKLPNLEKLIQQGVRAKIIDEPPLDSPKIWTTIATGRSPHAHGIQERVIRSETTADLIPVDRTFRRTKALWNIFSDLDRTVGIVGWFITWPAEPVNGFIISERAMMMTPQAVYPEILNEHRKQFLTREKMLHRDTSEFAKLILSLRKISHYPATDRVEEMEFKSLLKRLEEYYRKETFYRDIGLELYRLYRPDLFALYFHGPDALSHGFYKFRYPEEGFDVPRDHRDIIGDPIEAIYRFHDHTLGRLIELSDHRTIFLVLSDHGFQAQENRLEKIYQWDLDSVLQALGFLEYHQGGRIDWTRTLCYTSRQLAWNPVAFVRINLKGREKEGIISGNQFEAIQKKVITALEAIRFKSSNRPVFRVEFDEVKKDRLDFKVQPIFQPRDFSDQIRIGELEIPAEALFSVVPISGTHHIEGVFVLSGKGVRKGIHIENPVRTVDVAPTLLALVGLPLGEDLEGRVVQEALAVELLEEIPLRFFESYDIMDGLRQTHEDKNTLEQASESRIQTLQGWQDTGYLNK